MNKTAKLIIGGLMIFAAAMIVAIMINAVMTHDRIIRLDDITAELYDTVVIDAAGDKSLVLGPVECRTFKDGNNTILIPRKPGTYVAVISKRTSTGTQTSVVRIVCEGGSAPDVTPDPPVNPDVPDVSTFQQKFKELLVSSIPQAYRVGVCSRLADACAAVRNNNYASEEELLQAIQKAQREALSWDTASPEFRSSWFALFQANGPFDKLISEEYPEKVNWNKVLSDMEQVYRGL